MGKIVIAFCLVVVCLLAGATQTLAACPNGYSAYGHSCVPNSGNSAEKQNVPSSPSDETKKRYKPVTKLGVHHCPGQVVNGVCFF